MRDAVVSELSRDRGVHVYSKWQGAFWRLISLVDLGVEEGHAGAVAAAHAALDLAASPRRLAEIHRRRIDSHRTGEVAHHTFPALRFPAYWDYGPMPGLRTLRACGRLGDQRAADALDVLGAAGRL